MKTLEETAAMRVSSPPQASDTVVRAEALSKSFGDVVAVDDVSFALGRGTVTGFLGPNGAGKTRRCGCCSTSSSRRPETPSCSGAATGIWSAPRRA